MTRNIKILILSHISELVGGAERSIVEVMAEWEKKHGITPVFILKEPVGTLGPEIDKRGWEYYSVPYSFWSHSQLPSTPYQKHYHASANTKAVLRIEEIIKQIKPDVVLTNSIVCPWAAIAAHYQHIPHVWFVREYGDLDHGRAFEQSRKDTFEDIGLLSQLVVTNSKALEKHVCQYIPKEKVATLYHPFDIKKMIESSKLPVKNPFISDDSLKLVLPAGVVTETKGFLEAVTAVGKLNQQDRNVELCVIGKTYEKEFMTKLRKVIKQYHIKDKVHFMGFQKNPMPYVALADIGIMSSRMEAFGRVTFEYMVLGKPVVGVGAGGTLEMVENDTNGYLFEYRDTDSLVKALIPYSDNPKKVKEHGQASLARAKQMMKSRRNSDAVYKRLNEIINSKTINMPPVLHYSHVWLKYPGYADEGIRSIRKLIRKNTKARVMHYTSKAKAVYRRKFR